MSVSPRASSALLSAAGRISAADADALAADVLFVLAYGSPERRNRSALSLVVSAYVRAYGDALGVGNRARADFRAFLLASGLSPAAADA